MSRSPDSAQWYNRASNIKSDTNLLLRKIGHVLVRAGAVPALRVLLLLVVLHLEHLELLQRLHEVILQLVAALLGVGALVLPLFQPVLQLLRRSLFRGQLFLDFRELCTEKEEERQESPRSAFLVEIFIWMISTVKAPNFRPHGNFALFRSESFTKIKTSLAFFRWKISTV